MQPHGWRMERCFRCVLFYMPLLLCTAALSMPRCVTTPSNYFPVRLSLSSPPQGRSTSYPQSSIGCPPPTSQPLFPLLPPLQQPQHSKQGAPTTPRVAVRSSHHQALAWLCLTREEKTRLVTNVTSFLEKLMASHVAVTCQPAYFWAKTHSE